MTSVVLPKDDPRGAKAVALATDAGQWVKCTTKDGRKAYGILASSGDHYYLVGRNFCTCPARMHRPGAECKHMLAVALHCQLVKEQEAAAKYDDIFARFDDDPTTPLSLLVGRPQRHQSGPYKGLPVTERED